MSGFLSDIASWALGGGAGANNDPSANGQASNDQQQSAASSSSSTTAVLTDDEMRAKRMARLAAMENAQKDAAPSACDATIANEGGDSIATTNAAPVDPPSSMDVDKQKSSSSTSTDNYSHHQPMDVDDNVKESTTTAENDVTMEESIPNKKIKTPTTPASTSAAAAAATTALDPLAKLRRKKALLLRRVLLVTFGDSSTSNDHRTSSSSSSLSPNNSINCVHLTLDDDEMYNPTKSPTGVQTHHIAELLTARLSLSPKAHCLEVTVPSQAKLGLIGYLGGCYKRASEEWREMKHEVAGSGGGKKKTKKEEEDGLEEMCALLEQIKDQVVSYAASSLMVPDLFELGNDATLQLAKCLSTTSIDPASSITFDVLGKNTSFYYCVCEELYSQGAETFDEVIGNVVKHITDSLSKCNSLLDEGSVSSEGVCGNGLFLTSALRELCTNKKAAVSLTKLPSFLLPPANTPLANVRVETMSAQQLAMMRMVQSMRGDTSRLSGGYLRRSGPALEKDTILGLVLRLGFPTESANPALPSVASSFSNAASRSRKDVAQITSGFRRQLELYQSKCNELVKQLVIAGEESRKQVIQWLIDALLLNGAADAMRPDRSKVSSEELLTNLSVVLLKLCDPFIEDEKKSALVDPGFVCSTEGHGGLYDLIGENSLPRLGENVTNTGIVYNPKNSFIPVCFFFCTRSLALSVVPGGSRYENVVRNVYHVHRTIRQQNGDPRTDPRFDRILQLQYCKEIVMMSPTYIADVSRFYNVTAGIFLNLDKEGLKTMPEHIVDDMCSVLVYASSFAGNLLAGSDFGNLFRLTVTLLSKDYSHLVRNYNLRAKLGDVLHDIFLPGSSNRHSEVPDSVTCNPLAGGQPYLTSDNLAKETLAPSLLLLYGEVENTGYYDKNEHRTKIAALLKYLWASSEHKSAFKRITEDKKSFITFANGIVNEMNDKFASVMETLPSIRTVQVQMANPQEWGALSEEEREIIIERHESNEQQVKGVLPLCNSVMKMLGFLNTDKDIRDMFLLPDMCPRLANMLLHVLNKLVGSRGLDLKVDNPESYNFRPKEMLQDLCVVFSSFAAADKFQMECAKSGYYTPDLMSRSVKTCRKLNLLVGESMELFALLATKVEEASKTLISDEDLYQDAPDEFLDPLMQEFMTDPVLLPTSNNIVDRKTITQHLLNNDTDPFNRKQLTIEDVVPAEELKEKMKVWLEAKRTARDQ